ncbi:MAG: ARMT1-like domain-containing protein [Clostridia bacterium]|nr:ARMT1-like domain-containing protein [Clostridia bacterium]
MKTSCECWECFAHTYTKNVKMITQDEKLGKEIICRLVNELSSGFPENSPADIGTKLNKIIMEYCEDPFKKQKIDAKETALRVFEKLKGMELTLKNALKASLFGNIMDHAVMGWDYEKINADSILTTPISLDHSIHLEEHINKADTILFLTDNAGEVVLDYFLLKYIKQKGKRIILSPKEAPIQNDATLEDLLGTPTIEMVDEIIPTAQWVGLNLERSSDRFKEAFKEADLYIMKGMGYYENAFDLMLNSFFILKAKCIPVARSLGVQVGEDAVVWRLKNG